MIASTISIPLWYDWKLFIFASTQGVFNFNSTMVRLEEAVFSLATLVVYLFQFHYGTIGSPIKRGSVLSCFLFQFHYGTIGSISILLRSVSGKKFQFHYGTIGRTASERIKYFSVISIPLWYDWKLLLCRLNSRLDLFQFHYGTIGSIG